MITFEQLRASGTAVIHSMIGNAEETLHLEFKALRQTQGSNLAKEDRGLIAKAVTGLANAEGGILVIGIATKTVDGIDIASELRPIADVSALRSKLTSLMAEFLSPQHEGIGLAAATNDDGSGYVAINVPPSSRRPHMCVNDHRYYRRGSQGTRVMEHGEVRDLMFAPRSSELQFSHRLSSTGSQGYRYMYKLYLGLRNVGSAPASLPFFAVDNQAARVNAENQPLLTTRIRKDGFVGFYGNRDAVIHMEDEIIFCDINIGLDFAEARNQYTPEYYLKFAIENNRLDLLKVGIISSSRDPILDHPIDLACYYGAENAPSQSDHFRCLKRKMLQEMLVITPAFAPLGIEIQDSADA